MKILITGGCGFVGSNLCIYLKSLGHDVVSYDALVRDGSKLNVTRLKEYGIENIQAFIQDINIFKDSDLFNKVQSNLDLVIDCAAEPSVLAGKNGISSADLISTNLTGTCEILEYAKTHGTKLIFISTSRVYPISRLNSLFDDNKMYASGTRFKSDTYQSLLGPDENLHGRKTLYGATKAASEIMAVEYASQFDIPMIINRCGVIAGPWQFGKVDQGLIALWAANHYFKQPLKYFGYDGKQVRDVLHVKDLCRLIAYQILRIDEFRGDIFTAGGGLSSSVSLLELTALCQKYTGNTIDIPYIDEAREDDAKCIIMDNTKVGDTFGWRPEYTIDDVVSDTVEWIRQNEDILQKLFVRLYPLKKGNF